MKEKREKKSRKQKGKYTGVNRIFRSETLQTFINKRYDGTFKEFIGDWKWIFSFSKKYKGIIFLYTVIGIFSSTLSLGAAWLSKMLINIIVGKEVDKLWLLIGSMVGMTIFSLVFSSINSRIFTRVSIYVNNDIQGAIFDRIIDARWKELSKYPSGDLLNRFNGDVSTIASNAINWIPNLIINLYTFLLVFFALFKTDPTMAWIAFLSAPFLLLMSRYILRKMREYRKRVLELNSDMMGFEVETFYNFDMIKSFGIFGHYSRRLREWQKLFKQFNLDYNKFEIKSKILMTLVSTLVSLAAFGYCLWRLWTGQILYGDMTFFLQQRSNLSNRFNNLIGTVPGMLNSAVSAHRVRELIELPREAHDECAYEELKQFEKEGFSVKLRNVTFGYGEREGRRVYQHADFTAQPGEIVAVVASSGGGKTTLMRLLLGMLDADEGQVILADKEGKEVPVNADLRKFFSYVPQGNTILSGTIAENMRMVKEDATDEEIVEALTTACAYEFVSELPDGINGRLGERGRGVSEGQAQRLSIARAILRDAPILLLDEATSALDVETEEKVLRNIIKAHPNKVIIVSTHRPSALKLCDRIYRITEGGLEEVDRKKVAELIFRYADLPTEGQRKPARPMPPPEAMAQGSDTGVLPEHQNEGWWNE
ncbi:MAG: ABC transporter ATP-binding protein [Clostridia bacterium]|nr:ABC transporter ATP-binding protein [Clostridia bacterium]